MTPPTTKRGNASMASSRTFLARWASVSELGLGLGLGLGHMIRVRVRVREGSC
jgi:hypothetical protein